MDLKLHVDCCCPLNSYDKSHLNTSSYCFRYFAFILGALTNASRTINFHLFEFRLHCEIQTILCLEPYLILAFLYKILVLCLWFTITSCFPFCGVCACTCEPGALCLALVLGMLHLLVPVSEAANLPGVTSLAYDSWGYVTSEQPMLFVPSSRAGIQNSLYVLTSPRIKVSKCTSGKLWYYSLLIQNIDGFSASTWSSQWESTSLKPKDLSTFNCLFILFCLVLLLAWK